MPITIKLGKKEDTVSVIKKIKNLKEKEILFELERGSILLSSSANLKLLKRTGESLGKKVMVATDDDVGRLLAAKAGVLADQDSADLKKIMPKSPRRPFKSGDLRVRKSRNLIPEEEDDSGKLERTLPQGLAKKYLTSSIPPPGRFKKYFKIIAGAVLAAIIIGSLAFVVLPEANITVYARSEPVVRDLDLQIDRSASNYDLNSLTVPGYPVSREISQTKNFPVTGTELSGTKASGRVVITNSTNNSLRLLASTTTLVADGKNYFFTRDVSGIRPGAANEPVDIVAEQAGENYNLPAGARFEIRNAALGNQTQVYAIANTEITGGAATARQALTQEDLDRALEQSIQQLIITTEAELNQETPGLRLIFSGVKTEILAQTANRNIGDSADNFDFTVIARVTGLAYREDDVKNLISSQIRTVLSDDKYLVEGARQNIDAEFTSLDLEQGSGSISVRFDTLVAYKIETGSLSRILPGKKASEIRELLLSRPEIERVDVKFAPFYIQRAPRINGNINIHTALSQL